jgi:hypothetical protein
MLTKAQWARRLRSHIAQQLYDDSGLLPEAIAIYSLTDPRDLRRIRYVGQTRSPRRRFLQHLHTARLWLPDERPWWVRQPRLRPLYEWIRELHADGERLPTMIIHSWEATPLAARVAERSRILASLATHMPLLNVEREQQGRQVPLI